MTVPADVHDAFDFVEEQFNEALDQSLDPAGPGVLYDYVAAMGLAAGAVTLDAGCGDGMLALAAVRAQLDPRSLDRDDLVRHHCCV